MASMLRANEKNGSYDRVSNGGALSLLFTLHLREISNDKHINVAYDAHKPSIDVGAVIGQWAGLSSKKYFDFVKHTRLTENIALIELKSFPLNDLVYRRSAMSKEYWTQKSVSGKRYGYEKPVYVLTSKRTFSAAEEFSYNLKNLKRATIIGETTAGGANPGDVFKIDETFSIFIPTGRAINPITNTNWEGVGVKPDIEVRSAEALKVAQELAQEEIK